MRRSGALLWAVALGACVSTTSSGGSAVPSRQTEPVSIGVVSVSASHAPLFVALERGYFTDAGVEVKYQELGSGIAAMTALSTGELDVAVTVPSAALFNAVQGGVSVKIVSSMGIIPPRGDPVALVVRRDLVEGGRVRTVLDLKGRIVSLAGGRTASQAYQMGLLLAAVGLTLRDVDVRSLQFSDSVTALRNRIVDASLLPAPFLTEAVQSGAASVIAGSAGRGRSSVATLFSDRFGREHRSAARGVLVALIRGSRDLQGDGAKREENLRAIAKYTSLPIDTVRGIDPYAYDPDLAPDTNTVLDMQRAFIADSQLDYTRPLTADQLVDPSFSRDAVSILGEYPRP